MVNWVNLSTPLGLCVAVAGGARLRRGGEGLVLAEGYRWPFPYASAFTVGNVVISQHDLEQLERWSPGVLAHESRHAWQYAWCLGIPFVPLYLAAMGVSWLTTGDRASDNVFERLAGLEQGGYRRVPRRWRR